MSNEQELRDRIDELEQKLKHMDEIDTVDKEQTWVEILIIVWLVVLSGLVFFKERGGDPHQQAIQSIENRLLLIENLSGTRTMTGKDTQNRLHRLEERTKLLWENQRELRK